MYNTLGRAQYKLLDTPVLILDADWRPCVGGQLLPKSGQECETATRHTVLIRTSVNTLEGGSGIRCIRLRQLLSDSHAISASVPSGPCPAARPNSIPARPRMIPARSQLVLVRQLVPVRSKLVPARPRLIPARPVRERPVEVAFS